MNNSKQNQQSLNKGSPVTQLKCLSAFPTPSSLHANTKQSAKNHMVRDSFHKKIVLKYKNLPQLWLNFTSTELHFFFLQYKVFFIISRNYWLFNVSYGTNLRKPQAWLLNCTALWRLLVIAQHKHSSSIERLRHLLYVKDSMSTTGVLLKWTEFFHFPSPMTLQPHGHLLKTQKHNKNFLSHSHSI